MLVKLNTSFKWELRTLWLGPLWVILYTVSRQAAVVHGVLIAVYMIATDGAFSIVVTMIFLRPISRVLREGGSNVARHSQGYRELQKTMYMTLFGSSLAVFSSTALYVNVIVNAVQPDFIESAWSHSFVFGINLDSILNDVGMFFVCGVLKNAKWEHVSDAMSRVRARFATNVTATKKEAFVFDSKAYDDDI